jgi:hypothetical protein
MIDKLLHHPLFLKHRTELVALVMLVAIFAYLIARR